MEALLERDRETNHLIAGLQKMLTPLLGRPEEPRTDHSLSSELLIIRMSDSTVAIGSITDIRKMWQNRSNDPLRKSSDGFCCGAQPGRK